MKNFSPFWPSWLQVFFFARRKAKKATVMHTQREKIEMVIEEQKESAIGMQEQSF